MGQNYPLPLPNPTPVYVPVITYRNGTDADLALGNEGAGTTTDLNQLPRYQSGKQVAWNTREAVDVVKPLGPVGPKDPYPIGFSQAAPTAASLSPNTGVHGAADVTMTVTGTGFTPFSVIIWNGSPEHTRYISPTQVSTVVRLSLVTGASVATVSVEDHGIKSSPDLSFTIT